MGRAKPCPICPGECREATYASGGSDIYVATNPSDEMLIDLQSDTRYFIENDQYWVQLHLLSNYVDIYESGNTVIALSGSISSSYANFGYQYTNSIEKSYHVMSSSLDSMSTQEYNGFSFMVLKIHPYNENGQMKFKVSPTLTFGFKPSSTDFNFYIMTAPTGDGPWTEISHQTCNVIGIKSCTASVNNQTAYWKLKIRTTFQWRDGTFESYVKESVRVLTNNVGSPFTNYTDSWSGKVMGYPRADWIKLSPELRTPRDYNLRTNYITWYEQQYGIPFWNCNDMQVHHIRPLAFGGTNDYSNLIALPTAFHQQIITPWYSYYSTYDPNAADN